MILQESRPFVTVTEARGMPVDIYIYIYIKSYRLLYFNLSNWMNVVWFVEI